MTIVVDTSVLVAIALREDDALKLDRRLREAASVLLPAPARLEILLVLAGRGVAQAEAVVAGLVSLYGATVVAFTADHALRAEMAFMRFGKGRHPARLNYGDCMVYAVAAEADAPLLFKGDDFSRTDIRSAL